MATSRALAAGEDGAEAVALAQLEDLVTTYARQVAAMAGQ
jgi:hypothetical protein